MKLLMVARRYPPDVRSGSETVFANLYERASERHEVQLVAGYRQSRDRVPAEALGVDLRERAFGMSHLAMARAAASAARQLRPDVVLANSIEVPRTRYPTACIVHDLNFGTTERSWRTRLREQFYARRARSLDLVVSPSAATATALEGIGLDPRRIRVLPNGVDLDRFRPRPGVYDPERLVIAYPSRILPGKGQHIAIDAVARLHPRKKERVHLKIVGAVSDPIYYDQLRIHAYGQPVSFHPDVDDIVPYYQEADLVVFPTLLEEGFGYTAIEAMACGRPVAWSEQPAVREATGGIGFPVPSGDTVALRSVVEQMLEDPAPFARAGEAGRTFVAGRYSWQEAWRRYERVLSELV